MDSLPDQQLQVRQNEIRAEIERHYKNILHDPRLIRLRLKWAPGFDGKGWKQRGKNYLTLSHLPVIGVIFCWTDAAVSSKNQDKLGKVVEANKAANPELEPTFNRMQNNMQVQKVRQYTFAVCKTLLFFVSPAGTAGISTVVSSVASNVIGTLTSHGIVIVTKAIANDKAEDPTADVDINQKWGQTKAFLLYIGQPPSTDPIYEPWEESRLYLKQLYGANREDDLNQMKPKGELLKRIESSEHSNHPYDADALGVSLLLLLWRVYDCWTEKEYNRIRGSGYDKHRAKLYRARDERYILQTISPIDKHVYRLDKTFLKEAVELCVQAQPFSYGKPHSRFDFLTAKKEKWNNILKYQDKQRDRLRWVFESFFDEFMLKREPTNMHESFDDDDKKCCVWGYRGDENGELKALICFIKPDQKMRSLASSLSTRESYRKMRRCRETLKNILEWEDDVIEKKVELEDDIQLTPEEIETKKKEKYTVLHAGALLFYVCENTQEGKHALKTLLRSLIEYSTTPTFVLEHSREKERLALLSRIGFKEEIEVEVPSQVSSPGEDYRVKFLSFRPDDFQKTKEMFGSRMEQRSRGMKNLKGLVQLQLPQDEDSNYLSPQSLSPRGNSANSSPYGSTPSSPRPEQDDPNTYNYYYQNYNQNTYNQQGYNQYYAQKLAEPHQSYPLQNNEPTSPRK